MDFPQTADVPEKKRAIRPSTALKKRRRVTTSSPDNTNTSASAAANASG
jgi:hypothetical protein